MKLEYKRQLIHAAGALFILPLQIFGKDVMTIIIAILILASFVIGKYKQKKQNQMCLIRDCTRKNEFPMRGAITFLAGILFVVMLFPENMASAAIVVLAIGDSIATVIGVHFGKHKLLINKKKSLEGSLAFFASVVAILWFFDPYKAVYVAIGVTLIEMLPLVDDNLTVPITTAVLLAI